MKYTLLYYIVLFILTIFSGYVPIFFWYLPIILWVLFFVVGIAAYQKTGGPKK